MPVDAQSGTNLELLCGRDPVQEDKKLSSNAASRCVPSQIWPGPQVKKVLGTKVEAVGGSDDNAHIYISLSDALVG